MEVFKQLESLLSKGWGAFLIVVGLILFAGGVYFVPEFKFIPPSWDFLKLIGFFVSLVIGIPFILIGVIVIQRNFTLKTPKDYRPDNALINSLKLNAKCDIFHKVTVLNYSEYANQLIEKNPTSIFTVCTFEPYEIIDILLDLCKKFGEGKSPQNTDDIKNLSSVDFLVISSTFFPHFKTFKDFCQGDACRNVKRILILSRDFKNKNEKWMFDKFVELNGQIPCHVITKNRLEANGITFITDHVVYDDKFVIDYYTDSNTFILSYVDKEKELKKILLGIKEHFSANPTSYTCLKDFINEKWPSS